MTLKTKDKAAQSANAVPTNVPAATTYVFARRKIVLAQRLYHDALTRRLSEVRGFIAERTALIEATTVCPRVSNPDTECPLCGAIDDKNHEHPDHPRECSAGVADARA